MGTMNMKPDSTILILAALGIGGYFLLRRNAQAGQALLPPGSFLLPGSAGATRYAQPVPAPSRPDYSPLLNAVGKKAFDWFTGSAPTAQIVGPDLEAVNPGPEQFATDEYGQGLF